MSGWHSMADGPPPVRGLYLVWADPDPERPGHFGRLLADWDGAMWAFPDRDGWPNCYTSAGDCPVTHWMPLPDPPAQ